MPAEGRRAPQNPLSLSEGQDELIHDTRVWSDIEQNKATCDLSSPEISGKTLRIRPAWATLEDPIFKTKTKWDKIRSQTFKGLRRLTPVIPDSGTDTRKGIRGCPELAE